MNRSLQILIGVVFLAIALFVYQKEKKKGTAGQQTTSEPKYSWVDLRKGQAPIMGISRKGFNVFHITNTDKIRVTLKAEFPIDVGVSTEKIDRTNIKDVSFSSFTCGETQVVEYRHECEVPNRDAYLVMRWEGDQPDNNQDLEFSLEAWQCTDNCGESSQ